jgi:predicted ferric reductase
MEPIDEKMIYNSGQFAFFNFLSKEISTESHPFSISSASTDRNLKITTKNLGDYTSLMRNLKQNDGIMVEGPFGHFSYKEVESKNQIWIAGGIGITPFIGMAQDLKNGYNVDLYYSVKEEKEAVYLYSLRELALRNSNFRFNLWISKEKGYIKGEIISELSGGLDGKDIFLCGPLQFMESLKDQFVSLGVDIKKIHYENFSL